MEINDKIKNISGRKYAGSSLQDGKLYHDLPFKGVEGIRAHRSKTRERIEKIISLIDVKDKYIVDLGCSVGGISIGMVEGGAGLVDGIDHDAESIEVADSVSTMLGFGMKTKFFVENIDMDLIKTIKADIVLWFSQWMWFVKQYGLEAGKQALFELSKNNRMLVFESAANDGMAAIKGSTQDDIEKWLNENTVYDTIERHEGTSGWHKRDIFVCKDPVVKVKNKWIASNSIIERIAPDKIKKTFKPKSMWMKDREVEALKRLGKYKNFPSIIEVGADYIIMEFVGRQNQIKKEMIPQVKDVMKALEIERIKHRDIREENLVAMNGKLSLIDFGLCIFDDEKVIPSIKTSTRFDLANNMDRENIIKFLSNH